MSKAGRAARSHEIIAKANGIDLCYQTFGLRTDPPVILIMGMGAQMVGWDEEFCEALAERKHFVVRFDNRDSGRSKRFSRAGVPDVMLAMTRAWLRKPVQAPYLLSDMAQDVSGLMDVLGIEKAHLVGASMGGTIAQTLAIEQPERVRTLTSIMSTTGDPSLPSPGYAVLSTIFRPAPRDLAGYTEHYITTWKHLRGSTSPEETERDRARAALNHARGLCPDGGARQLVAILASGSRRQALSAVRAPTLVIHGDIDPLVPVAGGIDTARSIPGAELMILKGMGHAVSKAYWPPIIDGIAQLTARG
ncbi:Alpha/beta hydrolase [Burkholderiales bacterium 8X]|nr:Alpha/beta hydrolase [Burkholderiales bacterium 8X]